MLRITTVAVALLAALPFAAVHVTTDARAAGAILTVPPFHIGDFAVYDDSSPGPFNISIGGPTSVMDKSMHMTEAITATFTPGGRIEFFSARTMTLEALFAPCGRGPDGACYPLERWEWYSQGSPAILGATYLQGRSFGVGDSWELTGECAECTWRRVTIEAPNARSPEGTDFVANIRGDYVATAFRGRIHMTTSSPFPLLVEGAPWQGPDDTLRLLSMSPGATPILSPIPPEDPVYVPLIQPLPFEDGRPVEGTPISGWPSWSDARNASGPDEAGTTPGAQLIHVYYQAGLYNQLDLLYPVDYPRFALVRWPTIEARYAIPGEPDNVTTYHAFSASAASVPTPIIYSSATRTTAPASTIQACAQLSVPMWDTVRTGLSFTYLHDFKGFKLRAPTTITCAGALEVIGDGYCPPGGGLCVPELLSIAAHTGYLRFTTTINQT